MNFKDRPDFNQLMAFLAQKNTNDNIKSIVIEEDMMEKTEPFAATSLPLLIVKQIVLFPGIIMPTNVKQQSVIQLLKKSHKENRLIGVVTQRKSADSPGPNDIFQVGTTARVLKVITFPDGNTTAILQGKQKVQLDKIVQKKDMLFANMRKIREAPFDLNKKKTTALLQSLKDVGMKILKLNPDSPFESEMVLDSIKNPNFLTYLLAAHVNADTHYRQKLLEIDDHTKRATLLLKYLLKDLEIMQLKQKIQNKVHTDIDQQQRDFYLRQQIKILQDELGDDEIQDELDTLRAQGKKKKWPKEVAEYFNQALDKAERLTPHASDYPVLLNHAQILVDLPWNVFTKDNLDLKHAVKILDKDHYGLEKIKERILEYLAVLKLKQNMKGPILCFYGPPGIGKTSLGKSIAKALNKKYVRMSLGGLHDEAEVRGHRKTYVGAMPGKILQNIKKAKTDNPVFVLDEIDKISNEFRGDPSAALLEVLDPEQNNAFEDNFLEVPYDLSKVLFVATANSLDTIPHALEDRMEVIEMHGYTLEEKFQIAKKYLIPKQRKAHGLKSNDVRIYDNALLKIIERYTRESGVRDLERKLGATVRKVAKAIVLEEKDYKKYITQDDVVKLLGPEIFDQETYQQTFIPGVAIGLAWTPVGGEILFIESTLSRGKGKVTLSGQLGDVMKESAMTALSYIKAHAENLLLDYRIFENYDLHIHIPAGAVPKDGPSAGITLFTSLVSLYTQRKVKDKLAMTGEITLRGKILPVGGIKEKILAAKRAGMMEIILSTKNKKDIQEIKQKDIKNIVFHYVDDIEKVLQLSLQKHKIKNARKWHTSPKTRSKMV